MVREMSPGSRARRASHKSREITHETRTFDGNDESWRNENVAENTRTGLFQFPLPKTRGVYRQMEEDGGGKRDYGTGGRNSRTRKEQS